MDTTIRTTGRTEVTLEMEEHICRADHPRIVMSKSLDGTVFPVSFQTWDGSDFNAILALTTPSELYALSDLFKTAADKLRVF